MKENPIRSLPGIPVLLVLLAVVLAGAFAFANSARVASPPGIAAGIALVLLNGPAYVAAPIAGSLIVITAMALFVIVVFRTRTA